MFDLRALRANPEQFDNAWAKRGLSPLSSSLLALDEERRAVQTQLQTLQAKRNDVSKAVGQAKRNGEDADGLMAEVAAIKDEMAALETRDAALGTDLDTRLASLPNLPMDDVPAGADEDDNVEVRSWGTPKDYGFEAKPHYDLGEALGQMDFETAADMSGARFVILRGQLARMERALGQWMLDVQTEEFGREEHNVPYLVRDNALFGTSQLPKFEEDLFKAGDHYLIPTSEVPLTNLVAGRIIDSEKLPFRVTALTPCFRSEAGSAGRDTRGMLRQHQFHKVEMVSVTAPDQSEAELESMTGHAEEILKRLELPYRVMLLCAGDMGFGARKTYDLEVWVPGQNTYREISSCSNCWDFQARRMKARTRAKGEKQTQFVHTLNGSGLAVGRTLLAVMENHQNADGTITVPEVLRPYMGGLEVIGARG